MEYYNIQNPENGVDLYLQQSSLEFARALEPKDFSGRVLEALEQRFSDDGTPLKDYGIILAYDALCIPESAGDIIFSFLNGRQEFATAKIETQFQTFVAFRSFNYFDPGTTKPLCRAHATRGADRPSTYQFFSSEFLDFLGTNFDISEFPKFNLTVLDIY